MNWSSKLESRGFLDRDVVPPLLESNFPNKEDMVKVVDRFAQ